MSGPGPRPFGSFGSRTALVTGAGGDIGGAIATALAAHGAAVALVDLDPAGLARTAAVCSAADVRVSQHECDVSDPAAVAALQQEANAAHATIDIVVNCAGVGHEQEVVALPVEDWDRVIAVNLRSVFLVCRTFVPQMIEARWGRVINIASQMGQKGCPGSAHYSAAKAGVIGFTKALAREVVHHNVLVNAIAPGPVAGRMLDGLDDESRARKLADVPLGRFGAAAEVAPSVLLLAGDPSGNLYVGQTLGPNGGDVMA